MRFATVCVSIVLGGVCGAFARGDETRGNLSTVCAEKEPVGGKARLPRDNLLLFRSDDGETLPVDSIDDWQRRRDEIVRGMETVMGRLPGDKKRCPLNVELNEEVDCGSYVRRSISYASEPGSRVPAFLLVPKTLLGTSDRNAPAVLGLQGSDNVVGNGLVVGLGDKPNRAFGVELAERGYVVLAPNYPLRVKYQPDLKALGWESGTFKAVWDNIRGLDLLESLPFVDPERLASIGHSLGGHNSVYTAVFDKRIKAVVSSCGLDSYLDYMAGDENVWLPNRGWTQTLYMSKLADYRGRLEEIPFDFHELIGAIAPRHVLIIAPLRDHNFQAESVDRIAAAATEVYELYGEPSRLRVLHPDCEHDFPQDMRQAAYIFLDQAIPPRS